MTSGGWLCIQMNLCHDIYIYMYVIPIRLLYDFHIVITVIKYKGLVINYGEGGGYKMG